MTYQEQVDHRKKKILRLGFHNLTRKKEYCVDRERIRTFGPTQYQIRYRNCWS